MVYWLLFHLFFRFRSVRGDTSSQTTEMGGRHAVVFTFFRPKGNTSCNLFALLIVIQCASLTDFLVGGSNAWLLACTFLQIVRLLLQSRYSPTDIQTWTSLEYQILASILAPSTHIEVFLKTKIFPMFKPSVHTSTAFSCIKNATFRKRFPECSFFKKSVLIVIMWTGENEGFRIRWCHISYSACPVRDAIVFPSLASVFEWRGENVTCRRVFFFENGEKSRFSKISWYVTWRGRDHCVRQLAFSEFPKLSLSKRG